MCAPLTRSNTHLKTSSVVERQARIVAAGSGVHTLMVAHPIWNVPEERPALGPRAVHVWRFDLDAAASEPVPDCLSPSEVATANTFRFARDHDRYVAGRGALRNVLARSLECAPSVVPLMANANGKPELHAGPGRGLAFNLSHSHECCLLAVGCVGALGIDVELVRHDLAVCEIAATYFAPGERLAFLGAPSEIDVRRFFSCWARKEAYLKARGEGLTRSLSSFEISTSLDGAALFSDQLDPQASSRWTLEDIGLGPRFAAALAVAGTDLSLTFIAADTASLAARA